MALTLPHIENFLLPGAEALGLEIVAVEMSGGDQSILRVYIDREGGVDVEDCAKASRQFSAILDVEDPISNRYTLEVSSPGLDRPLSKPAHFESVIGNDVKIKMMSLVDGRRRFTGKLIEATDKYVIVEFDGQQSKLAYTDMDRARLVPIYNFDT